MKATGHGSNAGYVSLTCDTRRMLACGMLHLAALIGTDVSEECSAHIMRLTRICELGTFAVTSNQHMLLSSTTSQKTCLVTSVKSINLTYH
jgi:hypothetical protein